MAPKSIKEAIKFRLRLWETTRSMVRRILGGPLEAWREMMQPAEHDESQRSSASYLATLCREVLDGLGGYPGVMGNPDLHPLRDHVGITGPYRKLESPGGWLRLLALAIQGWFLATLRLGRSIIRNRELANWRDVVSELELADALVVSHLGGSDRPAGPLEAVTVALRDSSTTVVLVLRDGVSTPESTEGPAGDQVLLALPRLLGLRDEWSFFRLSVIGALVLLKSVPRSESKGSRRIRILAAVTAFKSNYSQRIAKAVGTVTAVLQPHLVISVFEGHPFERLIFAECRMGNEEKLVGGYLQSGIYPDPFAPLWTLGRGHDPDVLLVTGSTPRRMLEGRYQGASPVVLGSGREIPKLNDGNSESACLLLPDSYPEELATFLGFAEKVLSASREIQLILRMHPQQRVNRALRAQMKALAQLDNFEISVSTLDRDLQRSRIGLYRGSTSGVFCAAAGLPVAFLGDESERGNDPMYGMIPRPESVQDLDDLVAMFASQRLVEGIVDQARHYFDPINYAAIEMLSRTADA